MQDDAAQAPILVVEHPVIRRGFYNLLLDWLQARAPACRRLFELRLLAPAPEPAPWHRLLVTWLQDPVQAWSPQAYEQALALTAAFEARGIPTLNRVDRLARAGKASGAALMRQAGLRTPNTVRITDPAAFRASLLGLRPPLFVRDDWSHGGPMLRADDATQARALPLERIARPSASEIIELPDPRDALYRKYRYLVAGGRGVPLHLQASADWITRGQRRVNTERTRAEELSYIESPCPHHAAFVAAADLLGLELVAFDYGLDASGQPVVWEANPFPHIVISTGPLTYRNDASHRSVAAIMAMYLERAGLAVPEAVGEWLGHRAVRGGGAHHAR